MRIADFELLEEPVNVKVTKEFLGVPIGTDGKIVSINKYNTACEIKFECKEDPVLVMYPGGEYFSKIE